MSGDRGARQVKACFAELDGYREKWAASREPVKMIDGGFERRLRDDPDSRVILVLVVVVALAFGVVMPISWWWFQ